MIVSFYCQPPTSRQNVPRSKLRKSTSIVKVYLETFDISLLRGYRRYENDGLRFETTPDGHVVSAIIPPREVRDSVSVRKKTLRSDVNTALARISYESLSK